MGAKLIGYADASYATDIDTRRSVTGFAWFLGGNLISYTQAKFHNPHTHVDGPDVLETTHRAQFCSVLVEKKNGER